WKIKLDSQPREMHNLFPALIVDKVRTSTGPKEIAIVAGVSDNLFAIDAETGGLIWNKHFENTWTPTRPQRGDDPLCPGGITATPVIQSAAAPGKYTIFAVSWDGRMHQINVADGEELTLPAKFMPPNGKPYALNLWKNVLYTHTAQGCGGNPNLAYAFDLSTG